MAKHTDKKVSPEQLSQLMDGEWQDIDPSECVAHACGDDAMRDTWNRWHLIRDVARGESITAPEQGAMLASRIHSAIADEPTYSNVRSILGGSTGAMPGAGSPIESAPGVVPRRRSFAWGQFAAGGALAASVAVATVFGLDMIGGSSGAPDNAAVQSVASIDVPGAQLVSAVSTSAPLVASRLADVELVSHTTGTGSHWVSVDGNGELQRSEVEDRLNMFLSQHLEHSPTSQRAGMLPYSSLVGYDTAPAEPEDR